MEDRVVGKNYQYLHEKFKYLNDLNHALEMLCWDEDVIMPTGGQSTE